MIRSPASAMLYRCRIDIQFKFKFHIHNNMHVQRKEKYRTVVPDDK